ncbi:pentatricopeptide repeat-containing protein 1, mitochondrial [Brevipalpus obovatus]|uniref:pentatricopeptide repeat-containing protein 1, mitochondrial n=1 Tax=Brevipalpus obovatus TaxID=246614 RepID=UPI003D9F9AD0
MLRLRNLPLPGTVREKIFPILGLPFSAQATQRPLKAEHEPDEEDNYGRLEIDRNRKHIMLYKYELQDLVHKRTKIGLVEALKLFDEMRQKDRKKVRPYMYTMLITSCAKNGYLDKAFELFEEEKKKHLRPTRATIVSLFNACAESPKQEREKALERIEYLRQYLLEVSFTWTDQRLYHVMIKAYGKLGKLEKAYEIANEMFERKISLNAETFANLLVACISDKEKGFGEAIKLFRRMVFHGIPRTLYTYKLLLHAARECNVGSSEYFERLIYVWVNAGRIVYDQKRHVRRTIGKPEPEFSFAQDITYEYFPDGSYKYVTDFQPGFRRELVNDGGVSNQIVPYSRVRLPPQDQPNFLIPTMKSRAGQVINIDYYSLSNKHNRMCLIGGVKGILELMKIDKIKPDMSIFTQLLELTPNETKAENDVLNLVLESGIALQTGFFNHLIVRRCRRSELEAAKSALVTMQRYNQPVDLATFGALANGVFNVKYALSFFKDLENLQIRPNHQIIKTIITKACIIRDYALIKLCLEQFTNNQLAPGREVLDILVYSLEDERERLMAMERGKIEPKGRYLDEERSRDFTKLEEFFEDWCSKTTIQPDTHPWDQFKFERKGWNYYKMHKYEQEMKRRILERKDVQKTISSGEKVHVEELIHDVYG